MILKSISLQNFRNFSKAAFRFSSRITVIVGANAVGKTNILEAIYLLSTGKSWRVGIEQEMIQTSTEFGRVKGWVIGEELEILLTRGEVAGERVGKKKLAINGIAKRLVDYQGNLRVVLFGPWDMDLIIGSPTNRRKFLDNVLSQTDREYRRAILSYEKGVRARNKLLERIRDEGIGRAQLLFWDRLLVRNGDYISRKREEFINFVNLTRVVGSEDFNLEYDKSAISESRLAQYAEEEVAAAATLVGPHRDDIRFRVKEWRSKRVEEWRDLAVYGSRGEQRMCILWLKLAELVFIESVTEDRPVLLLDDIFSELDHDHRKIVIDILSNQQTILTTADPHTILGLKNGVERIEL